MNSICNNMKLCECGCGQPAPTATRNWHSRGVKKGQQLRFVCGHHRRGVLQSKEEKAKRVKSWGKREAAFSPFLPNNKVVHYSVRDKRWYCDGLPHARAVYEHFVGEIPKNYHVHHKNGSAEKLEYDNPDNLIAIPKVWNLHYLPWLANGFYVPESKVTECYVKCVDKFTQKDLFKEVCRMLVEESC